MPYHRRQAALGQNKRSVTQMTASCFLTCSVPSLPPPSRACCFLGYTLQRALCCLWACALPGPFAWSSISLPSAWLSSFSPTLRCQLDADAHLRSVARTLRTAPHSTFHSLHISSPVHCIPAAWEPCKRKDPQSPECPGTNSATQSK